MACATDLPLCTEAFYCSKICSASIRTRGASTELKLCRGTQVVLPELPGWLRERCIRALASSLDLALAAASLLGPAVTAAKIALKQLSGPLALARATPGRAMRDRSAGRRQPAPNKLSLQEELQRIGAIAAPAAIAAAAPAARKQARRRQPAGKGTSKRAGAPPAVGCDSPPVGCGDSPALAPQAAGFAPRGVNLTEMQQQRQQSQQEAPPQADVADELLPAGHADSPGLLKEAGGPNDVTDSDALVKTATAPVKEDCDEMLVASLLRALTGNGGGSALTPDAGARRVSRSTSSADMLVHPPPFPPF